MKLNFYQSNNFGDALNPYIFNHFIPNLLNEDSKISFVGIGSILGMDQVKNAKKKVIYSSGFAYGKSPILDDSYDVFCVRGPLTCKELNIDEKFAITDGASLLQFMGKDNLLEKKFKFSFMPHWESALKYNWKTVCDMADINYIDPKDDHLKIINQIQQSEIVIAEAMHAAIVADTLRIPWIPVKAYGGINSFKWTDWTQSLNMEYLPVSINSLFHNTDFTRRVIKRKTSYPFRENSLKPFVSFYELYQSAFLEKRVIKELDLIKKMEPYLSNEIVCKSKGEQLLDSLDKIKLKYSID